MADEILALLCECGVELRGLPDDLVAAVQRHARDVHNMSATREQVLQRARPT